MPSPIDLKQTAASTETEAFRDAVCARDTAAIGNAGFTASGGSKNGAPVRPTVSGEDFTATGTIKDA